MKVAEDVVVPDKTTTTEGFLTVPGGAVITTGWLVTVAAGVFTVALVVLGAVVDEVAVAFPLLDVAPGVNTVALLLLGTPVGEVAVARLVLPEPLEDENELELLLLLLEPGGVTPKVGLAWQRLAMVITKLPIMPRYK